MCQAVRKLHGHLKAVKEAAVERKLPQARPITLTPQEQSLDEDLDEAAQVSLLAHDCSYLLVRCFWCLYGTCDALLWLHSHP